MESDFETILYYISITFMNHHEIYLIMRTIESSIDILDFEKLNIELISSSLHNLYTIQNPTIRAWVLRICYDLEFIAKETITERCCFHFLLASSIDQKPRASASDVDEEKYTAFKYISMLLKFRRRLPTAVMRAMVSLYQKNISIYNDLLISYFCEAALVCENVAEVPEICQILVAKMIKTSDQGIVYLFAYSLEKRLPLIRDNCFLGPLLSPFSQLNTSNTIQTSQEALSSLMRTWSGLLSFGIQSGAIADLVRCLPHETDAVIGIFRDLLKLDSNLGINVGYCGFLLSVLLKLNLVEKLNKITSAKASAVSFLNELLPFTSHSGVFGFDYTQCSIQFPTLPISNAPNSLLFNLSQTIASSHQVTTITKFSLPQDSKLWDWSQILMFLTVVLPHNEIEAQSLPAKQLYNRLFQFFSGPFLNITPSKCSTMAEPLFALIQLLMSKGWGVPIIENSNELKQAMLQTLLLLQENVLIDQSSPQWALFRCVTSLMSEGNGISILSHWGFHEVLHTLGVKCTNPALCETILDLIKLYPEADLSIPVFWTFLSSQNNEVHKIAINDLRKKRDTTPNFQFSCFRGLLMPHVKELSANNSIDKLPIALNLLGEIISTDDQSLMTIITDKQMHEVLCKHSHFIYSLLLSKEEVLEHYSIDYEIKWWMEFGNIEYLKIYDKAVQSSFEEDLSVSNTKQPEIFNYNGFTKAPPHLFGQVSQTKIGIEKLTPMIDILLKQLEDNSLKKRRAAFFALAHFSSVPNTIDIVEKNDIASKLIASALSSSSYVLKGTLISCLSLFYQSKYLSTVLQNHKWELFRFGSNQCVIPCDPFKFFEPPEAITIQLPDFKDIEGFDDIVVLLKQQANSLLNKTSRSQLTDIYKNKRILFNNPKLALYSHSLLGNFYFTPESREFILYLFKCIPLLPLTKVDLTEEQITYIKKKISQIFKMDK